MFGMLKNLKGAGGFGRVQIGCASVFDSRHVREIN